MSNKFSAVVSFASTPEPNYDDCRFTCTYEVKWPCNPNTVTYEGRGKTKDAAAQSAMSLILERMYF